MLRSKMLVVMLFALLIQALCLTSHAQTIRFYNARGQEIKAGNPFPLDRFSRGETCNIRINDSNG